MEKSRIGDKENKSKMYNVEDGSWVQYGGEYPYNSTAEFEVTYY